MKNESVSKLLTFPLALAVTFSLGCPDSTVPALGGDAVPDSGVDLPFTEGTLVELIPGEDAGQPDLTIPDGMVCLPGTTKCMGSNFLQCKDDGSDWTVKSTDIIVDASAAMRAVATEPVPQARVSSSTPRS